MRLATLFNPFAPLLAVAGMGAGAVPAPAPVARGAAAVRLAPPTTPEAVVVAVAQAASVQLADMPLDERVRFLGEW